MISDNLLIMRVRTTFKLRISLISTCLGFGLADYTKIINKPMDIGTVGQNLAKNHYEYIEEVLNDL